MIEPRVWKPFEKQEDFLKIPDTVKEALFGGSVYSGKTELGLYTPVLKEMIKHSRFQGLLLRRTFPELEASLIPRSRDIYPHFGGKYNSQTHAWMFPSGASIRFGYMETEKDIVGHFTTEYQYIFWEELTTITADPKIYKEMSIRCRRIPAAPNLPAFMRAASNPLGIGHKWVRERFVDPNPNGYSLIREKIGEDNGRIVYSERIFIPCLPSDNPYCSQEYLDQLEELPEAEKQAKKYGNWYVTAGEIFTEFRIKHFKDEPANALHVIEPIQIPQWWPKFIAVDWGWDHPVCILWAALSPEGRLYIYREYATFKTDTAIWAATCRKLSEYDGNIVDVVIDPSATQQRTGERTVYQLFNEHSGFDARLADNDRVSGKTLIHEYLRWKEKGATFSPMSSADYSETEAMSILRNFGQDALTQYQSRFIPDTPELYLPKLQIFNTCKLLIDVIPSCQRDPDKPEDVLKFLGDDPYDAARYLLKAVKLYTVDMGPEVARMKKRAEIIQQYETSGDANRFYQRMDHLEAMEVSQHKPIKRFHKYLQNI